MDSTLSEEEIKLLKSTYSEDYIGLRLTNIILKYARHNEYVMCLVGQLLEILTNGKHLETLIKLDRLQGKKENQCWNMAEAKNKDDSASNSPDKQLDKINKLIQEIQSYDEKKTDQVPSTSSSNQPSDNMKMSNLLCDKLTALINANAEPVDINDLDAIKKALGIKTKATKRKASPSP